MKIRENYLKNRLIYNFGLLLCLFFVNCFWANAIFIVYPILLIMIIVDSLENGFSYIVFTIPYCLLKPHLSVLLFFICIVAFIIKFIIFIFVKDKIRINKFVLIFMGVLAIYCVLPFGPYNLNLLLKMSLLLFLFAIIIFLGKKSEVFRIEKNIYILTISLIIACLFSATYFISPYAQYLLYGGHIGLGMRYQALFDNPNVLALLCEFLLPLLCYFVMSRKSKWYELLLIVAVAFIGTCTYSKTFYIILTVVLISLFIWKLRTSTKKTLIITGIVLIAVALLAVFRTDVFVTMRGRFVGYIDNCHSFEDMMNMITTSRYGLWMDYLKYTFTNSPLHLIFGYGLGAYRITTYSPHNAYISMFYQFGIVGTILFIATMVMIFISLKKENHLKLHKAIWLPIIVLALVLCVEDTIFYILFK